GTADLVGTGADLGHAGDSRVRSGRDAAPRPARLRRARPALHGNRGARRRPVPARCPGAGGAVVDMSSVRLFFVGGLLSFRALFGWLSPWVLIPTYVIAPIFQILLFVYIGRAARTQSDEFYVIGNALQYAAIPCVFAMTNTIAGERYQNTLSAVLATPAKRIPLFAGRSLPVIVNGFFVAVFAFAVGGAIVGIDVPAEAVPSIALVILVSAFACTGLGLATAAVGLLARDT